MDKQRNAMSEAEIITQASEMDPLHVGKGNLLDALEAFYMNGFSDEQAGEADTTGHRYRVHRWIVWTDSQGFHSVETYDTEAEAEKAFAEYEEPDCSCSSDAALPHYRGNHCED